METAGSQGCRNAGEARSLISALCSSAAPAACKMQEHFEHSNAKPPLSFSSRLTCEFLPLYVWFLKLREPQGAQRKMSQEIASNFPGREMQRFCYQVWKKTKQTNQPPQQPTTPDDFSPSYFEKWLRQSPREGSAEPCAHSPGIWARTEVSWSRKGAEDNRTVQEHD